MCMGKQELHTTLQLTDTGIWEEIKIYLKENGCEDVKWIARGYSPMWRNLYNPKEQEIWWQTEEGHDTINLW